MKITKSKIKEMIRECVMEHLGEESQPELYDAENDQFSPGPRDRTLPSKSSQQVPEEEDPLYVEYHSQRKGEVPFKMGGDGYTYEYVNATYPNGKVDIGVYVQPGDVVYSYNAFRNMYNIQ